MNARAATKKQEVHSAGIVKVTFSSVPSVASSLKVNKRSV